MPSRFNGSSISRITASLAKRDATHWPYPRDRLERLALAAGMSDEALRDLLHDAI